VLRRRDVTRTVVIPLASALVARREEYFDLLTRYREGDAEPIVAAFVHAATLAARESGVTANRMAAFPDQWREALGAVRGGSATARLLEILPRVPVLTVEDAEYLIDVGTSALYRAVERLVEAEVLRPLTDRKRNQVWGVGDMLDELDDLGLRIGAAARASALRRPTTGGPLEGGAADGVDGS
jgi:hypothetical protein